MRKLFFYLLLLCLPVMTDAHIGSPGVTFEGKAGDHDVLVLITPPDVIPGTATVDIYTSASGIRSVWAKPVYWFAGDEGTPSADEMLPVEGEPGHYRGIIWLMNPGTSGISIDIKGDAATGSVIVPVMAVSTAQKEMPSGLGWTLLALCIFLVILMITIISASMSDGLVKPGDNPEYVSRKRWKGVIISTTLLILILWGGKTWWDNWSARYNRFLYRPLRATSTVLQRENSQMLELKIDTTRIRNLYFTRRLSLVVPDHGKLMHMFLVRAGTMDVFAHLHPKRQDSATYIAPLPPLPAGKYLLFADITRLSGFAETIPDTIEIENKNPLTLVSSDSSRLGRDDTYFITNPIAANNSNSLASNDIVLCGKPGVKTTLSDGSVAIWEHEANQSFTAGKLYELTFNLQDEAGAPAKLEPYLGMMGHAVVMKDDGSVYIHLHPVGNYSMASQQTMLTRFEKEKGAVDWNKFPKPVVFMDSVDNVIAQLEGMSDKERNNTLMPAMEHSRDEREHREHTTVKFPYSFPSAGNYRIWIQMKRNGKILNSAFDAVVTE